MRSPCALAPRNVDSTSLPDQRWASADRSPGFSIQIQAWPGRVEREGSQDKAQVEVPDSAGGSTNMSGREVSKDRQRLRGQTPAKPVDHLPVRVDRRLHVQAASQSRLTFLYRQIPHCPSFVRSLPKHVAPRERLFPHTEPFHEAFISFLVCSLRDTSTLFTKPAFPLSFARLETRARLSRRNRQLLALRVTSSL